MKIKVSNVFPAIASIFCILFALVACRDESSNYPLRDRSKSDFAPNVDISEKELVSVLKNRNTTESVRTLNQIKAMQTRNNLVPLIESIWNLKNIEPLGLDATFVSSPRIRIEIGDILVQASNSGFKNLPIDEIEKYLREELVASNPDIRRSAIHVLGELHDSQDIDLLISIAAKESDQDFQAAALAISFDCVIEEDKINELKERLKSETNRRYMEDAWVRAQVWRRDICGQSRDR